jgi:hypothetical protein
LHRRQAAGTITGKGTDDDEPKPLREYANEAQMGVGRRLAYLCLDSPFAAAAEPAISEELSYYDIVGASPADLVAQMNALGPIERPRSMICVYRRNFFVV